MLNLSSVEPNQTVLLTGGAGFIGSGCLRALLEAGAKVVVVDNFDETLYPRHIKERYFPTHPSLTLVETDLRQKDVLKNIFQTHNIDAVLHLAALAGVRPSIQNAPSYFDVNVTGTSILLETAQEAGVKRFVLASSSSVYGANTKTPFAEEDRVEHPESPYAASKRSMELLARTFQKLHDVHVTCLRFFTVYGPRQRPEMAIHKFMRLMEQGEPIPMFGDGSTGRDYTYIDDITQGVMSALARPDGFKIYNLGGDRVVLLRDLIATIGEVMGVEPKINQLPQQQGDVPLTCADLSLARRELDFAPQTSIRDGLEKMWAWYQSPEGPRSGNALQ